jgi:hypothetical protein
MGAKKALEDVRQAEHQRRAPSTQAAELVREEIEHIREGKHGARSWPEWRSDSSDDFGWFGVHLMTGSVKEVADRLQKTLNEEEGADKKLTSIA